jgi:osmotically-inducible protein OsmY
VDRGTVTLTGYAYRGDLEEDAVRVVRHVTGVDEVSSEIEILPASLDDDRIRWATFYRIYTDDFLSRYAPGGPFAVRRDFRDMARFPGMQPVGRYPIHIVVNGRRTLLVGVVDNEADKTVAGFRAREVTGVFGVENDLMVE